MKLKRHCGFSDKVPLKIIHGNFPYKYYLEIIGTNKFGKYIAVVSNEMLHLNNKSNFKVRIETSDNVRIHKNSEYTAKIINVADLSDVNDGLFVFEIDSENTEVKDDKDTEVTKLKARKDKTSETIDLYSKFICTVVKPLYFVIIMCCVLMLLLGISKFGNNMNEVYIIVMSISAGLIVALYFLSKVIKTKLNRLCVHKVSIGKKILFSICSLLLAVLTSIAAAMIQINMMMNK